MNTARMEELYQLVGEALMGIIPEEWIKVLLYAKVDEGSTMVFFYYYPLGKNVPEYCHDIYKKWDMPEEVYKTLLLKIFDYFSDLWKEFKVQEQEQWTNLTLILENSGHISIDYDYTNIEDSDPDENHIIWRYKYLNLMPDKNRKRDVQIIQDYLKKQGL